MRRMKWSGSLEVRDDRGRPIPAVSAEQRYAQVWETRRPWLQRVLPFVCVTAMVAWFVYHVWWLGNVLDLSAVILGSGFVVVGPVAAYVQRRLGSIRMNARVHAPVAWLNAHRLCGACGYSLREIEPGPDGIAVCPECGAAWHEHRWTMADRDPKQAAELQKIAEYPLGVVRIEAWDDRFVPITGPQSSREGLFDADWIPEDVRRPVRRGLTRARLRRVGIGAAVIFAMWAGGVLLTLWIKDPLPRERTELWLVVGIGYGLIGLLVLYVVNGMAVGWLTIRAAWLHALRCPSCGESVADQPEQFDHCVACSRCKRAWRRPAGPAIIAAGELGR